MTTHFSPLASVFAQQSGPVLSPWVLLVIFILLVVLFVWLLLRWQAGKSAPEKLAVTKYPEMKEQPEIKRVSVKAPAPASPPDTVMTAPAPAPVAVLDDLEIIEGIGPKIAGILKQAGITSFAQLAEMQPERITQILQAGGIRLVDPHTWPQQARLAAAGDQAGLKALQDRLKGGREV